MAFMCLELPGCEKDSTIILTRRIDMTTPTDPRITACHGRRIYQAGHDLSY